MFLITAIKTFGIDDFGLSACVFAILVVGLTIKMKINNPILQWLGTYSFAIYIMQRFPMNILRELNQTDNIWFFTLITIPTVLFIAFIYQRIISLIDTKILY